MAELKVVPLTDFVSFHVIVGGSLESPKNVIKGKVLGITIFSLDFHVISSVLSGVFVINSLIRITCKWSVVIKRQFLVDKRKQKDVIEVLAMKIK